MYFHCRGWGHLRADFPKKFILSGKQDNAVLVDGIIDDIPQSNIKIDSGAQHSMINADIVRPDTLVDETTLARVVQAGVSKLPLAMLHQFGNHRSITRWLKYIT